MASYLLTLMADGRARTHAYDESSQSVLELESEHVACVVACAAGGAAQLSPSAGTSLLDASGTAAEALPLPRQGEDVFVLQNQAGEGAVLHVRVSTPGVRSYRKLGFSHDVDLVVGRGTAADVRLDSPYVSERHARLELVGDDFYVTDLGSSNGTYLNDLLLGPQSRTRLNPGDVVGIMGLTIMAGRRLVLVNQPESLCPIAIDGAAYIDHDAFKALCPPASEDVPAQQLFFPAPRLAHTIHKKAFEVDEPPAPAKSEDKPALMQMGPSFIMGLASVFSASTAIQRVVQGGDLMNGLPSIAMAVAMMSGMVVWPMISRSYTKKIEQEEELRRQSRYTDYLNGMEARFGKECEVQAQILQQRRLAVGQLEERASTLSPSLMNRGCDHDDFMELRVGVGTTELDADFRWPQRRFTLDEDPLMDNVSRLAKNPPKVHDVPLSFNPVKQRVAGIVGPREKVWAFARGLVVQISSLYSYQDVKLVLLADPGEEGEWECLRTLPHLFDDSGVGRYIASDYDGLTQVSGFLNRELDRRLQAGNVDKVSDLGAYFVVLCASKHLSERCDAVSRLLKLRKGMGFSVVFFGQELRDLPRECAYVMDLTSSGLLSGLEGSSQVLSQEAGKGSARMFDRDDVAGTMTPFEPDIMVDVPSAGSFALDLARVHLDMPAQRSQMPKSLGFLEMFETGNLAQLNIGQRWQENDASRTLQTPVGRDAAGEYAMLNLHEHAHGPHGLIAGTTGSGKSEYIITYILSMCVNYPPDQVSFVLIDYKGGGLAGAFENDRYVLPHLAGTITNLDGAAISRSLTSIQAELKRRQDMLNKARDITGEATVDIYKYLRYYRQGVLTEPLPHLFIVADEFAELKQQEPEFMEELISAARIGRSLGVHLILATQKPSGVVNDQIWSNSRFKVCLKVSDAADSKEMIRRPDAAEINRPGQFYMLVGYNESFTGGQAAYCGAPYAPTETFQPKRDNTVELIDDTGDVVMSRRPLTTATKTGESELNAVLGQIMATARATGKQATRLWAAPLPAHLTLDALRTRNELQTPTGTVRAALGMVDDPSRQRQFPYVVDLAECGNLMLYGAAGSGVDGLLATLLLSLTRDYSASEVCYYVLDLGTGSLTPFAAAPQCGGVVLAGDVERVDSLVRLVRREMARRNRVLSNAGCSFAEYEKTSSERLGHMVVAISNLASFYDLFPNYEEELVTLTRDAPRYGIHFVLTAAASNVPRMRLRGNFSTNVVLSLNDPNDVVSIFGKRPKAVVAKQDKRGYVRVGKETLEFKGASVAPEGQAEAPLIAAECQKTARPGVPLAMPIPTLPPYVHAAQMLPLEQAEVPVGFDRTNVCPVGFSFARCPSMLVFGNDIDSIARYLRGMRETLEESAQADYLFVDTGSYLGQTEDPRVLQDPTEAATQVALLATGQPQASLIIFTSIVETLGVLPDATARALKDFFAKEKGKGSCGIVAASEMWRCKSIYEDWYKVLTAYGNGVWVGGGFGDQTYFKYPRLLSEYRQPANTDDGFLAMRGGVTPVRLVSPAGEERQEGAGV